MNVNTMLNLLALRLEDADKVIFGDDLKLRSLNNGVMKLCQMIRNEYLTELQEVVESKTATAGVLALSELGNVLRGIEGITKVKIHGGLYATEISMEDLKKTENTFLSGSAQNPIYYLYNNSIYINNGTTDPVIDVFYLKIPSPLLYGFAYEKEGADKISGNAGQGLKEGTGIEYDDYYKYAVIYDTTQKRYYVVSAYDAVGGTPDRLFTIEPNFTGANEGTFYFLTHDFDLQNLEGVTCELNSSLHEIIVTLAEAECWSMDGKLDRRANALKAAMDEISILNERYIKAEGLGTRGRK